MSSTVDILSEKKILMVVSDPATSGQTGWPIGFWWAELTHAFWEFAENGYQVEIASPAGGPVRADSWSDPRDESGYSASDLISLGFVNSPEHAKLVANTAALGEVDHVDYSAVFLVGGQGPMYTFYENERVHDVVRDFYEAGKITAVVCHATCVLLRVRLADGSLLVNGKTWTGFANSEEDFADDYVGQSIQPFRIETEARKLTGSNFIVQGAFRAHAVRDGNLITGQQQYSGAQAARLVIEALGR
ncbi:type 1 glutamine amidotransferase domain-containing protein [Fodinicola feengrottensis]|uniref:Type 1 glutamine amidotransferase domain-containing protein n=1 Tax=Fodinicola feengrottensis TaxID=435914 RepID=A0ABN2IIW8_9ACTN